MNNTDLVKSVYLGQKGYTIIKSDFNEDELIKIRKDLTIKPYIPGMAIQNISSYLLYRESPKKLYIPRMYGINNICNYEDIRIGEGNNIDVSFTGELREYQNNIVNAYLEESKKSGCGLLEIYAGAGKTVMALKIISELRKKTLIIVHKEFLMSQWMERIEQFIPTARIGKIQGNTFDVEDKDIVLGMLQSLSMRDYREDQFRSFGMTIVDECFSYDTNILTRDGYVKIGDVYENWFRYNKTPDIYSYNSQDSIFEYKKLTYAWKKRTDTIFRIDFEDNSNIECTSNHKILTDMGYKEARHLRQYDIVLTHCIKPSLPYCKMLNNDQFQVVIGSLLSNRCFIHKVSRNTYRTTMYGKNYDYIVFKRDIFGKECIYKNEMAHYFDSFPFHYSRELNYNCVDSIGNIIDKMDIKGFTIWIMEVGYLEDKTNDLILSVKNIPKELHEYLINKIQTYLCDVELSISNNKEYLIFKDIYIKNIFNKIYSYIVSVSDIYKYFKVYYNKLLPSLCMYSWNYKDTNIATLPIERVSRSDRTIDVYDIEVQDNHNYIVQLREKDGLIVHNCHHIGAEVFCRALFKVVTKYMLGLSATMKRKDGLSKVFKMFLGDVVYKYKRQGDDNVVVKVIQYKNDDPEFKEEVFNYRGQVHYSVMIKKICEFNPRTEFIIKVLCDYISKESQENGKDTKHDIHSSQVMILAHNKSILKYLYDAISSREIASVGYYLGGMKEKELKKTEDKKVVIATYAMAEEALDIKTLSCLFLTSPRTDVTQAVGRILRVKHKNPVVYDIVDQHPIFQRQFTKRRNSYIQWKYKIIETDNFKYFNNIWNTIYNSDGNEKIYKKNIKERESEFQGKCILKVTL